MRGTDNHRRESQVLQRVKDLSRSNLKAQKIALLLGSGVCQLYHLLRLEVLRLLLGLTRHRFPILMPQRHLYYQALENQALLLCREISLLKEAPHSGLFTVAVPCIQPYAGQPPAINDLRRSSSSSLRTKNLPGRSQLFLPHYPTIFRKRVNLMTSPLNAGNPFSSLKEHDQPGTGLHESVVRAAS